MDGRKVVEEEGRLGEEEGSHMKKGRETGGKEGSQMKRSTERTREKKG